MTLKTWLSSTNVHLQKPKMSAGVAVLPISNPHESPTRGCTLPTSCGALKARRGKDWKTRSVEDGLESSLEQGDYGFLEYFSLRQCSAKETTYCDPRSRPSCGTWNPINSTWNHGADWQNYSPAQFYPGTLSRQESSSRKRSRRDRPHSIHHESHHKCFFRSDDLRTSTPISSIPSYKESIYMHSLNREKPFEKRKHSSGLLKRNSVLAKLRPDKWKSLEGTLRRCRSRDDVLSSSPKKSSLGASQPDLLISHNVCRTDMSLNSLSPPNHPIVISPPAPISILPPTCRHDPANVSQTLPRRRRPSESNKENTLLARGKRWLTGATHKENERNRTNLISTARMDDGDAYRDRNRILKQQFSENVFTEHKITRGETFNTHRHLENQPLSHQPPYPQEKHPLEQMRCRRPLTFYLLEDYLSPVKASSGVELDEYFGKSSRVLFNEAPQRPLPPTPEWDIPSLSPPSSLISGCSHRQEPSGSSGVVPISPTGTGGGRGTVSGDTSTQTAFSSPEKVGYRIYSPLVTSKEPTEDYPRFVTPEQTMSELIHRTFSIPSSSNNTKINHNNSNNNITSPHLVSPPNSVTSQVTSPTSPPSLLPLQPPPSLYTHSSIEDKRLASLSSGGTHNDHASDVTPSHTHFPSRAPRLRSHCAASHQLERRASTQTKERRTRKTLLDAKYNNEKSPGQAKETLQRLGRTGGGGGGGGGGISTAKGQGGQGKARQNGLIVTQKLPVLATSSNSSSRINLPLDTSRNGVSEGDLLGIQGHSSTGALPVLNNNQGELTNETNGGRFLNKNIEDSSPISGTVTINQPMTPQDALKLYGDRLTNFEKKEIEAYPEIWYLGLEARKIHGEEGAQLNGGYDDENGSYNKVMHDHISYRYEILEVIGKGSFGQVIRAIDHRSGEQVAIKIIRNKKRFHHQALVEVKILDHLRRKDKDHFHNVIHMFDYFYFRNHLCITFELMGLNLYELVKKNSYQGFGLSLIRRFAYSLVQCLRLLSKENIIHCDLKPENVLLKERGGTSLRIIDFGSSCYAHQRVYTYIQSRFYRSPEVILGLPYGMPIDVWSLGCILAELYTGYPLFPGENEVEQLACIMEAMGQPPQHLLATASRRRLFFDSKGSPRCLTNSKGKKRRPASRDLAAILKSPDSLFIDFITRCLEWDPSLRMTPDEALQHEWLQSYSLTSTSSSSSSSSMPSTQGASTDHRKSNGNAMRRHGPITADTTESDAPANQYRVYKNKKRDSSTTRVQVGGSRVVEVEESRNAANNNKFLLDSSSSSSSSSTKENKSSSMIEAGSENSLDDSGTYLPPIL